MLLLSNVSTIHQFSLIQSMASKNQIVLAQHLIDFTDSKSDNCFRESLTIVPKTPAFVLGERVVQPVVSAISRCLVSFNSVVSSIFNFPPAVSAAGVDENSESEEPKHDEKQVEQTHFNLIIDLLSGDQARKPSTLFNFLFEPKTDPKSGAPKNQPLPLRIIRFYYTLADIKIKFEKKLNEAKDKVNKINKEYSELESTLQRLYENDIDIQFYTNKKVYILSKNEDHYMLSLNGQIQTTSTIYEQVDFEDVKEKGIQRFQAYSLIPARVFDSLLQTTSDEDFIEILRNAQLFEFCETGLTLALEQTLSYIDNLLIMLRQHTLISVEHLLEQLTCQLMDQHIAFVNNHPHFFRFHSIPVKRSHFCYWEIYFSTEHISRHLGEVSSSFITEKFSEFFIDKFWHQEHLVFKFGAGDTDLD